MVLAELTADVAEGFQYVSDRRVFRLQAKFGSGQPNFGQAGPNWRLARNKCGASRRAALLSVPVSEKRAFFGDAVNVWSAKSHDAVVVGADVVPADIVTPDDQNVRFLICQID